MSRGVLLCRLFLPGTWLYIRRSKREGYVNSVGKASVPDVCERQGQQVWILPTMVGGHKVSVVKFLREPECNSVTVLRSRRMTELHGPSSRKTSESSNARNQVQVE